MRRALFDIIQALRGATRAADGSRARWKARSNIDLAEVRDTIHSARKIAIEYVDERQRRTARTILPIATAYYVDVTGIAAWCALRQDKWINKFIGVW